MRGILLVVLLAVVLFVQNAESHGGGRCYDDGAEITHFTPSGTGYDHGHKTTYPCDGKASATIYYTGVPSSDTKSSDKKYGIVDCEPCANDSTLEPVPTPTSLIPVTSTPTVKQNLNIAKISSVKSPTKAVSAISPTR